MPTATHYGTKHDTPDDRDHRYEAPPAELPPSVDLRSACGAVYTQGMIRSCSAHALASALTFLERKRGGPVVLPSRLFMYYNARAITKQTADDSGATIRDAIKALHASGACDESLWPYDAANVTVAPPSTCYENATMHALQYARIAQDDVSHARACLAEGYTFVLGIEIYHDALHALDQSGHLAPPTSTDTFLAGHAVMAVGYDANARTFTALNSEGPSWGDGGYFTFDEAYVTDPKLAFDLWTIRKVG